MPEWPKGADCKSAGLCLRWFESTSLHNHNARTADRSSHLGDNAPAKLNWYSFWAKAGEVERERRPRRHDDSDIDKKPRV